MGSSEDQTEDEQEHILEGRPAGTGVQKSCSHHILVGFLLLDTDLGTWFFSGSALMSEIGWVNCSSLY